MSNIEISKKNNWFFLAIVLGLILFLLVSCATRHYTYRIYFEDGSYEYYDLTYKVREGSKVIEYDGETIMGVDKFERIK